LERDRSTARVLVVEDDPSLREIIRLVLEQRGCRVDEAADGNAALSHIASEPPDIVVADLRMRPITGPELIDLIRCQPRTRRLPVILLTGDTGATVASTKADAVVIKPFEPDALMSVIRRLISG